MIRLLAALPLAVALGGCISGRPDLAAAVKPADIAYAMCLQRYPGQDSRCAGFDLPIRSSETAYSLCLDYHSGDARPCRKVRDAYEADLAAVLDPGKTTAAAASFQGRQVPAGSYSQMHHTAEQLYVATSRDAQTFEAALLIPEIRQRVQAVLRSELSDDKLRALAAQSKAESLYWYRYMQGLERRGG